MIEMDEVDEPILDELSLFLQRQRKKARASSCFEHN